MSFAICNTKLDTLNGCTPTAYLCFLKGVPFLTLLTHVVFNLTGAFSSCLSLIREAKEKDDAMIKAINLIFFPFTILHISILRILPNVYF